MFSKKITQTTNRKKNLILSFWAVHVERLWFPVASLLFPCRSRSDRKDIDTRQTTQLQTVRRLELQTINRMNHLPTTFTRTCKKATAKHIKPLQFIKIFQSQTNLCGENFWFRISFRLLVFSIYYYLLFSFSPAPPPYSSNARHSIRFFCIRIMSVELRSGEFSFRVLHRDTEAEGKANNKFKCQIIYFPFFVNKNAHAILEISSLSSSRSGRQVGEGGGGKLLRLLANINLYVFDYVWILHSVYMLLRAWKSNCNRRNFLPVR